MKLNIVGASNFVTRFFEACGPYQWAREFLKNSEEAGATRVEFGIEWQAVERDGVFRRTISDNGSGMDRDRLREFFSTLGAGDKKIGGVHDNFGVGAKIAALPWNPIGMVVISYVGGKPSMIRIELNADTNEYELVEFQMAEGRTSCVVDPSEIDFGDGIDWNRIAPDWARDHGTTIVLLGSDKQPDTILGNPGVGENDIKGLSVYLNSRFWSLVRTEVVVVEVRSEKKTQWPTGPSDRDDARRPNNRSIRGANHFVKDLKAEKGRLAESGEVLLDDGRVRAEWYLWEGERPAIHSYARRPGYIAVRYRGELYEITSDRVDFRHFGVIEQPVRQNLFIVLEPQFYDGKDSLWGVHPDQSRNRLIFTGNGDKGVKLPLSDWGLEFSEVMPKPIVDAIRKARGEGDGSIKDEEYRKRLQEKFGNRWTVRKLVRAKSEASPSAGSIVSGTENVAEKTETPHAPEPSKRRRYRKQARLVRQVRPRAVAGGDGQAVEREVPVSIPSYRYATKEEFEREWLMAQWAPNDPDGPTVILNSDAPMLLEAITYHQEQYPVVHAEEIQDIVKAVYGEVAVAKIAHSEKLAARGVSEEELEETYRSDEALTIALMGLMAEESLIAQRLGKLGRKKSAA
jgi:hypothetical protein